MKYVLVFLVALLIAACQTPIKAPLNPGVPDPNPLPVMPDNDPDGLSTPEGQACLNMRRIYCSDGNPDKNGRTCYQVLMRVKADNIIIPTVCLANASSVNIIRYCGDENTMRVRCL